VKAIYRYEVPIDDRPHRHILGGEVIGVASRLVDVVEFWAIHDDDGIQQQRAFQVFGTGQEIPAVMATEYGDHPQQAAERMAWARRAVASC
jgi:hypothetical protein